MSSLIEVGVDAVPLTETIRSSLEGSRRRILFTGVQQRGGVSAIAADVALALAAASNAATVLIDVNFHFPYVAMRFGLPESPGLGDVLAGSISVEQAVQATPVENLSVLTVGRRDLDSLSLRLAGGFARILGELDGVYSNIVIDTAPILDYPDALALAASVDGVVLVAAKGRGDRGDVIESQRMLSSVGVRVLGVVMTEARKRKRRRR